MTDTNTSTSQQPFKPPTVEELASFKTTPTSNLLPTPDQLKTISDLLTAAKVPAASLTTIALELANFCYDNGSSSYTAVIGPSSLADISLSQVANIVKASGTSLRKFCRYFAPIIWNLRTDKLAPANWEASGYKPTEKYAAFDFFDGVENPAALQPPGGLVRTPTQAERIANQTNKQVNLFQAAAQDNNFASNSAFITKGQISGSSPTIQFLPPPE